MAAVMEYIEAEFGIRDGDEQEQLHLFLRDLHSAFCDRLEKGERLEDIAFPAEVLQDYESEFEGRLPSRLIVDGLRTQFANYGPG